ncbi:uncharacterized protein LOC115579149 [Sparus aurata]|nr:uncharacterized protein LOC115579149 [Sparus aurata]XP_030268531.1 uncharacterized protein LOC115579149 [Sparus aurata]
MATTIDPVMLPPDLFQSMGRRDYPTEVSNFVLEHRGNSYNLKNPAGAIWKVGGVDDTVYKGNHSEVDEWGKFYLRDEVSMQVVGVVTGKSCPCDQLVLMTCKDGKFYAYDGEELHVVASSLEQLAKTGIEYPAKESYYNGEAFKHMTEKDWDKVRKGAVGKRLDEAHRKLVTAEKSKFLANLA